MARIFCVTTIPTAIVARMKLKVWLGALGCAIALSGCDDDNSPNSDSTTGSSSSTTDDVNTTIPVTSVTETMSGPTTDDSTSSGSGSDTDTDTDGTGSTTDDSTSSTTDAGESTSSTTDDSTTTGDPQPWDIGWCNLQHPPTIEGSTATVTTAYARVYAEGLTDQTPGNDIDAQLVVEFGYGDDDSDPSAGGWTWVAGTGNPGWDGTNAGQPNNDEYQGDLQFAAVGTYDYAARVSGDSGATWVYCDLNGLVEGGYTSDQAGAATIE